MEDRLLLCPTNFTVCNLFNMAISKNLAGSFMNSQPTWSESALYSFVASEKLSLHCLQQLRRQVRSSLPMDKPVHRPRNYRFYLLFICKALAFYTLILAFTVRRIRSMLEATGAQLFSLLRTFPEAFALAALSFMAICFLACLLAFHAFLVTKNETSHESEKGCYRSSPNPYDKGALGNIKECLLEKLPPPRVDFRALAEPELALGARTAANSDADRLLTPDAAC
ncbi:hypothetical protein ACP70R_004502 [Stipagrostis hirtigluma subsp. patula]